MSPYACPHCTAPVFRESDGGRKIKARTSILVIHKGGEVEINCPSCSRGVLIPLVRAEGVGDLRKALSPALVVPKA